MLCTDQQNHILSKKDLNKKVVQSALNQEPKLHQQLHLDKIPLHSAGTLKYELLGLFPKIRVTAAQCIQSTIPVCTTTPYIFDSLSVYNPTGPLRSSQCAFNNCGPVLWNKLSAELRSELNCCTTLVLRRFWSELQPCPRRVMN